MTTGLLLLVVLTMLPCDAVLAQALLGIPIPSAPGDILGPPPEPEPPDPRPLVRAEGYRSRVDTDEAPGEDRLRLRYVVEYDREGRPTVFRRLGPAGPAREGPELVSAQYDAEGRLTFFSEARSGCASGCVHLAWYRYDESGRLTWRKEHHSAMGCASVMILGPENRDGTSEWQSWCSNIAPEPPPEVRTFGTMTRRNGVLVRIARRNRDGTETVEYAAELDAGDRLVADRTEHRERRFERDPEGRITAARNACLGLDGRVASVHEDRYAYDDAGRLVRHWRDHDGVTLTEYAYDKNGRLARERVFAGVTGPDARPEFETSWSYDSAGRPVRQITVWTSGKDVERTETKWTWDRKGRLQAVQETTRGKDHQPVRWRTVRLRY